MRDNLQAFNSREGINEVLGNAVAEVFALGIVGEISERQDGNGTNLRGVDCDYRRPSAITYQPDCANCDGKSDEN